MPVLVEAFSVITRKDRVEQRYPGGMEGFLRDCPNRTACFDDHLVRVGFMDPESVEEFVATLERSGLVYRDAHGHAQDLVVVNQTQGPTTPCDWIEVFSFNLEGAVIEGCRLVGTDSRRLACPGWWRPEKAAQRSLVYVPSEEMDSRMEFLREENGLTVCRDRVTGKIMYSPVSGPPLAANSAEQSGNLTANDGSWWKPLLALFWRG